MSRCTACGRRGCSWHGRDIDCLQRGYARRTTLLREVGEALRVYARGAEDALLARIDAEVGEQGKPEPQALHPPPPEAPVSSTEGVMQCGHSTAALVGGRCGVCDALRAQPVRGAAYDAPTLTPEALDELARLEREAEETTAAAIAHGWRPDIARQQAWGAYTIALRNAAPALIALAREALEARSVCRCGEPCRMHATLEWP